MRLPRLVLAALLLLLMTPAAAHASRLFAITGGSSPRLLQFAPASPGTVISSAAVTGLAAGEVPLGMDLRPADGGLYVLTNQISTARLRRIDPATGALATGMTLAPDPTDATAPYTSLSVGGGVGVDFNPVPDRLRIVTATHQNLRVNPATGLVLTDTDLNPANPQVTGVAYTNSFPGASSTTLYDFDPVIDHLSIQNPPNNGTINDIGSANVDLDALEAIGFDIAVDGNVAYVSGTVGDTVNLYTLNTSTGVATLLGAIGNGTTQVADITAAENLVGFTSATATQREDAGTLELTVTRGNPRGLTTVDYATTDGTAIAGSDYTATSGTLTFTDGEAARTISIPVTNDGKPETPETFTVTLSGLTPVTSGTTSTATIASLTATIADDDPDRDADGVPDAIDVCPALADPGQSDANHNGVGTACDIFEQQGLPPAPDVTKPVILLSAESPTRKSLRSKGLPLRATCNEACSVRLTLRQGRTTIGTARAGLSSAGRVRARVLLTKKGKAAIAKAKSLTLSATATDTAGNRGTDKLVIALL